MSWWISLTSEFKQFDNMSDAEPDPPVPNQDGEGQRVILDLTRRKRNAKRNTTKVRHKLERLLASPPKTEDEVKEIEDHIQFLWDTLEESQATLDDLTSCYLDLGDNERQVRTMKESEEFELECQQIIEKAQAMIIAGASSNESPGEKTTQEEESTPSNQSSNLPPQQHEEPPSKETENESPNNSPQLPDQSTGSKDSASSGSNDDKPPEKTPSNKGPANENPKTSNSESTVINRRLKPLTVPMFDGNKANFEGFWTLFESLVDLSEEPVSMKMARLRQSLSGNALESIRGLGVTKPEYDEAKEILKSKFGGSRRQLRAYLDELEKMPPLRQTDIKGFEKFADLVRISVVKLQAEGREGELGDGTLHSILVKKLTDRQLESYTRWITEHTKTRSVVSLKEWLKEEVAIKVEAEEMAHGLGVKSAESNPMQKNRPEKSKPRSFFNAGPQQRRKSTEDKFKPPCTFCNGVNHGIWNCKAFQQKSIEARWNFAKEKHLCFRCLAADHQGKNCRRSQVCNIDGCQRIHHRFLHRTEASPTPVMATNTSFTQFTQAAPWQPQSPWQQSASPLPANQASPWEGVQSKPPVSMTTRNSTVHTTAYSLRTIPVWVKANGKKAKINAILDDGSNETFLNEEVASGLGLQEPFETVQVHVLNNSVETFQSMPVKIEIESVAGNFSREIEVRTCPRQVTGGYKVEDWNKRKESWPHLQQCEFPKPAKDGIVDLLIGVDNSELHYSMADINGKTGEPIARLGPLGWTCVGATAKNVMTMKRSHIVHSFLTVGQTKGNCIDEQYDVNNVLRKFWEVDSYGTQADRTNVLTKVEKEALNIVQSSLQYTGSRYQVAVPWKENKDLLCNNREAALKRLEKTEKNLEDKEYVQKEYRDTVKAYVEKGYLRKLPPENQPTTAAWYLPHFPLVRMDKTTTKVRIVFDCSARHLGVSLNDVIHAGPKLQAELFDVLIRFRRNPIGMVCDIKEMYLQIEIEEQDRPFFRILWRDCETDREPDEYEFTRVVFGKNSAPMESQFVSQENARRNQDRYPLAAETVLKSTYMDDSIDSVEDETTALQLYQELQQLWQIAGMQARKWVSNSKEVVAAIPKEYRASEIVINNDQPITKTLGVSWSSTDDTLTVSTPPVSSTLQITKRNVLKRIAAIFDPLGLVSPVVITGKALLQTLWTRGYDWDDEIQDDTAIKINTWLDQLAAVSKVKVPRCIRNAMPITSFKLIAFVDASTIAYGAAVYARCKYGQSSLVSSRLLASKSRVAPLVPVTVPRLELMAAVLGLRLIQTLIKVLQVAMTDVTFYSDSLDVLWWIRGYGKDFRPFVANRVGEIQMFSDPTQWQHVSTKVNPADLISRGVDAEDLAKNNLWWEGPDWLLEDEANWPKVDCKRPTDIKEQRQKPTVLLARLTTTHPDQRKDVKEWRLNPNRHSSWMHLVRIHARVIRVLFNMQCKEKRIVGKELLPEEIVDAEEDIIRQAQYEAFKEEYEALAKKKPVPAKSPLAKLSPRLDDNGIIRLEGRLMFADLLPYDVKFPIILPRGHHVTRLIVKYYHEMANHAAGTNFIFSQVSQRFWIMGGREEIRSWESQCNECKKRKTKLATQVMAPLPQIRLRFTFRPFDQCAVDYAGPFTTVQGRGIKRQKRYLCLFTCLQTRAIHLEMAWNLDTDSFLNAFTRFTSRRGVPTEMISDNGTNFVGAANELRELVNSLDQDKIQRKTNNLFNKVQWHFNPPAGPHFGGVHEAMVKSAKVAIYSVLGQSDIRDEELITAFTGVESLLNSRPLTYQSSDHRDITPLTPNHFLHGQLGGHIAPESVDTSDFSLKKRWRRVQQLITQVWSRWLSEYLPTLNRRPKWNEVVKDLKDGDIVLVLNKDLPRGRWPLGRIIETYPGKDGHTRVAKVQCGDKTMVRPIHKLVPLFTEQ